MRTWIQFVRERFDPLSHFLLIALFVAVHGFFCADKTVEVETSHLIILFFATVIFFFNLRLYDEVKDYETDKQINPTRPLPRGLITHKQLYRAVVLSIISFLSLCFLLGLNSLLAGVITIAYSLLMYKEFFIGDVLRPKLTTYAMTHTLVTILLSLTLIVGFKGIALTDITLRQLSFALSSWCFFNIFEFGRKTFSTEEERENVDTYSSLFGKSGACLLTFIQAILGTSFLSYSLNSTSIFIYIPVIYLLIITMPFLFKKESFWGKVYRGGTSFYIILTYVLISFELNF